MSDTLAAATTSRLEVKHSRFITHAAPVEHPEQALAFIAHVSDPDATHNCWAYRIGAEYRSSDDGEPAGTAGRPILAAIEGQGYDQVVAVVTRYFGGVLLGTGGLVRAYTQATQAGIEAAELVVVSRCVDIEVRAAYGKYDQLVRIASDCGAKVLDTVYDDAVTLRLRMLDGTQEPLLLKITELERGQERVRVSEPLEAAF